MVPGWGLYTDMTWTSVKHSNDTSQVILNMNLNYLWPSLVQVQRVKVCTQSSNISKAITPGFIYAGHPSYQRSNRLPLFYQRRSQPRDYIIIIGLHDPYNLVPQQHRLPTCNPEKLLARHLARNLLDLLDGVIRLGITLALLAPLEHEPRDKADDGEGADGHTDGDAGDGALAQAGGRVVVVGLVGLVGLGARVGGGELELLRGDVEAGGLDVEVGGLDEGLRHVNITVCFLFKVEELGERRTKKGGGNGRREGTYHVGAGVELLVGRVVVLVVGPVLELDGGVGAGLDRGDAGELVALVAGLDLGDGLDDLGLEVTGRIGVYAC